MSIVPKDETRRDIVAEHIPRAVTVLLAAMFVAAMFAVMVVVAFPYLQLHRGVFRYAARVVPFPAMIVDRHVVWYQEIAERANALETLAGLSDEEAVAQAVVLALRHVALLELAETLHVDVSADERAAFAQQDMALVRLQHEAAWSKGDYLRLGVASYVLAERVETAALAHVSLQGEAWARAERIQEKRRQGIPFANLATQYSEGQLPQGDTGYVEIGTLPEALAQFAETASVGDESAILESALAFWLVRLEDRQEKGEDGTQLVWLRAIEVKKSLLAELLDQRVADSKVIQFLR